MVYYAMFLLSYVPSDSPIHHIYCRKKLGQNYLRVRWGILVETVKKISKEINSRGGEYVYERHNLCPIPEKEIIKNVNLEQNPGYETSNK